MKPYISIIIPYYNAPEHLGRLLTSIRKSKNAPPYEIIVVDDGSEQSLSLRAKRSKPVGIAAYHNGARNDVRITVARLSHNKGPAIARNRGVAKARGKFVVFLDGDVEVFPDTLYQIGRVFTDDPDVVALTGVWVKEQKSNAFFPNFKALRDWSYWINERDKSGYYFLFSTRVAAIKKAVFERLGGFDETYPAPLVEDIELTYRIARRYAIIFAPKVRVRHEFEGFMPIARKYFLRAYYWTKLYKRRKKFDPVATTFTEAVTTVSGVGVVLSIIVLVLSYVSHLSILRNVFLGLAMVTALHLFLVRKFLVFVYHERGLVFAVRSFIVGLVLYCIIFAGAAAGRCESIFSPLKVGYRRG